MDKDIQYQKGEYSYYKPSVYRTEQDYEQISFRYKRNWAQGMQILFIIQIIACITVIIFVLLLKSIGGNVYDGFKNWYISEINRSLIAEDANNEYNLALNNINNLIKIKINGKNKALASTMNSTLHKPLETAVITTHFSEQHKGVDLAANKGTAISSCFDGIIAEAANSPSFGNYIKIEHENGMKSLYAHCDTLCVTVGDTVKKGQQIATVGSSGNSTGDHLHMEISINDEYFDPLALIDGKYS